MNESAEDYIKTIYILMRRNACVHSVDIARELGFSRASVSAAMTNLRGKEIIVMKKNGEIEFYGKMSEIQEEMEQQGFVRIHQSYLVSKDEIRMIRRDSVIVGEVELPVSRRYAEQVKHLLD